MKRTKVMALCTIGSLMLLTACSSQPKEDNSQVQNETESQTVVQELTEMEEETQSKEETQTPIVLELKEDDYPKMISGHLTKEELEFVLAYGPEEIPETGFTERNIIDFVNAFCNTSSESYGCVTYYGVDERWNGIYSLDDINRFLLSFTDFIYTEENDSDTGYGLNVKGDKLVYAPATLNYSVDTKIFSTEYTEEEMKLYFTYDHSGNGESVAPKTLTKMALLKPTSDGLYRIVKIEEINSQQQPTQTQQTTQTETNSETQQDTQTETSSETQQDTTAISASDVKTAYANVLKSIQNGESGYRFENVSGLTGFYEYFLYDINGDGIDELIVGAEVEEDVFLFYQCRVYTYDKSGVAKRCDNEFSAMSLNLAGDKNGLYHETLSRGTGKMSVYRITLQENQIVIGTQPEYTFTMGDSASQQFATNNPYPKWKSITEKP